ncbi:MAG: V-type ATP synthase subunit E [Nitrosopumilaceae archaeon]|nr:V-type ATP synthase subunit E [Nitrosopumilaceae archaeon]
MELNKLENLLNTIITQSESELTSNLIDTLNESKEVLLKSYDSLANEYDKIINNGKKESDKLTKQIIGSAELESRNKQLAILEEYIEKVFSTVTSKLENMARENEYSKFLSSLIDESIKTLGTSDIEVSINDKDETIIKSVLTKFTTVKLASKRIACLGGIKAKSKNGAMILDNTIDARLANMKPLIRKEIATKFGVNN